MNNKSRKNHRSNSSSSSSTSTSSTSKLILYMIILGLYMHALIEDWRRYFNDSVFLVLGTKEHHMFGGRSKYLTFLDMNLQCFYFFLLTMQALNELFSLKIGSLEKICNFLYVSLCFPVGVFVFFSFWTIYLIDRELIWSTSVDILIPPYQNHIMHTLPLVGVLLDNFVSRKNYGESLVKGYIPLLFSTIGYTCWLLIVKYVTNIWAYPIFEIFTNAQLALFFVSLDILVGVLFLCGEKLNRLLWGKENRVVLKKEF